MFFAMHNASFNADIVGWHAKRMYDGVRPITAIRYLKQGQMVYAWGGPGRPTEYIPGEKWIPYNPGSNLTPAFPGYISGHSIFSSASATVLRLFTGSDRFKLRLFRSVTSTTSAKTSPAVSDALRQGSRPQTRRSHSRPLCGGGAAGRPLAHPRRHSFLR